LHWKAHDWACDNEKAKYFYDEMKITEDCTFCEGSKKNQPCKDLR